NEVCLYNPRILPMGYKSNQMNFVVYLNFYFIDIFLFSSIAEVLDKHLSMVQRDNEQKSQIFYVLLDNEQKSQIIERQIREYLPNLVQILRTILQFYVRGGFRLEEDAV
ncbi:hypothetical protein ACJX0J_008331, partial [Zea mays]